MHTSISFISHFFYSSTTAFILFFMPLSFYSFLFQSVCFRFFFFYIHLLHIWPFFCNHSNARCWIIMCVNKKKVRKNGYCRYRTLIVTPDISATRFQTILQKVISFPFGESEIWNNENFLGAENVALTKTPPQALLSITLLFTLKFHYLLFVYYQSIFVLMKFFV